MATITVNADQSISLNLDEDERETFDRLPARQMENYMTLWLKERSETVWRARLAKLSAPNRRAVLAALKSAEETP